MARTEGAARGSLRERDFLTLWDVTPSEFRGLLARAAVLKEARKHGQLAPSLKGKSLGMIFEKPSTRTRVSFEVGMVELGGHAVSLAPEGSQIGRGEPLADTARVLSGYCHAIVLRTFAHARAEELARWAPIPIINGLTDLSHPCQVVADLFTVCELRGHAEAEMLRYAWIGDGNNMANAWIDAAAILGLHLVLSCPSRYDPDAAGLTRAREAMKKTGRGSLSVVRDPADAIRGADVVSTDVWASMGQEKEQRERQQAFLGYCLDQKLLAQAHPDAIVLHCLPAHRGEEITDEVIEGPQSAVWREAENRLHTQKAILELLLLPAAPDVNDARLANHAGPG
jgi:ornithine carbamoyltransferase